MSFLWTTEAFVAAAGGRLRGQSRRAAIAGVSIDSRTIEPGEAFVAISGERFDGHDFVGAALNAGAALAIVAEGRAHRQRDGPLLVVPDDPLAALERIGAAARARMGGPVVAVTGSVGKTGTKEMLRLALSELGATHAPVGSFNNHWGVPLTLARMPAETGFGVFEIGMNHAGEIRPLTKLVRPHVAIVTTVEPVHRRLFRQRGGDRRGEGRDLRRAGARRHGGAQPRQSAGSTCSPSGRGSTARGSCPSASTPSADVRLERVALQRGCVERAGACCSASRVTYRLGAPGPASGAELARGARRGACARRGPGARAAGARALPRAEGAGRAASADRTRPARSR